MPNWKKVLVSGSNAHLNQVTSSGGITTDGDLTVGGDSTVDGDLLVTQYIKHKGDTNTLINFTDNRIRIDAGGINGLSFEKDSSAPYPFTINNGGNRVNFRVVDRNTDLLLKTDSEEFNVKLYHAGNQKFETNADGIEVLGNVSGSATSTGSFGFLEASNILFELDDNGDIMPIWLYL